LESLEELAQKRIREEGGLPSFEMVPGYHWATCININEGVVHGIPEGREIKKGDVVSVDVGMFYKNFHTDTSFTVQVKDSDYSDIIGDFIRAGQKALEEAIKKALPGNRIGDISETIEKVLKKNNLSPVRSLTGHGIGRLLHEEPAIPCFLQGEVDKTPQIKNRYGLCH